MFRVKFLVVEDSGTIRKLVSQVIKLKLGCSSVFEAGDGKEALEVLRNNEVDFIISDWEMPNMSGDELLYEVRNNPEWALMPFVMMTSHQGRDHIMTAMQNGVTDYLAKPFPLQEFEAKIRMAWTNSNRRKAERYYQFPKHKLTLKGENNIFSGQVVNISRTGALLELEDSAGIQLSKEYELTLECVEDENTGLVKVLKLHGSCTRLELIDSFANLSKKCHVALWFGSHIMDNNTKAYFDTLLARLSDMTPYIIGKNSNGIVDKDKS